MLSSHDPGFIIFHVIKSKPFTVVRKTDLKTKTRLKSPLLLLEKRSFRIMMSKRVDRDLNHICTGLFPNLKRLGGSHLAISCQMTMELGKDIPWVEICTN